MKKFALFLFDALLLAALTSCGNTSANSGNPASAGSHAVTGSSFSSSSGAAAGSAGYVFPLSRAASGVCFREGTEKDGPVAVPSKEIAGFYAKYSKENQTYQVVLQLTEQGKKAMAESTERLSKSAGSMSLWAGETKLRRMGVFAPIEDGSIAVSEPDGEHAESDCAALSVGHPVEIQSEK